MFAEMQFCHGSSFHYLIEEFEGFHGTSG